MVVRWMRGRDPPTPRTAHLQSFDHWVRKPANHPQVVRPQAVADRASGPAAALLRRLRGATVQPSRHPTGARLPLAGVGRAHDPGAGRFAFTGIFPPG